MATKKKTKTPPTRASVNTENMERINRKRQVRLFFGLLFLLAGTFTCLAIASYFFTWQADQDALLSGGSAGSIMLQADAPPASNWGGRLGATLSHLLVYKGFGLASLAIGLWLCLAGLHIINGGKSTSSMRYLRWASLTVLTIAPILTFLFADSDFPWGGAWGNQAIEMLNSYIGKAGTSMVLIAFSGFVLFVIFALDISPLIRRARQGTRLAKDALKSALERPESGPIPSSVVDSTDASEQEQDQDMEDFPLDEPEQILGSANTSHGDAQALPSINDQYATGKQYQMTLDEKQPVRPAPNTSTTVESTDFSNDSDEEFLTEDELAYQQYLQNENSERLSTPKILESAEPILPQPAPIPTADTKGLSFEVVAKVDEAPAKSVAHGAHISIQDGEAYAPELDLPNYKFPTLDLLEDRSQETVALDKEELEQNKNQILNTLRSFGIEIQRISATVGPTVTLYEIVPAEGVRISKIRNLEDDIALNLAALGIRIIAPIPGRGTIGIEVPNANKQIVSMRGLLQSDKFVNSKMSLPIALGKKIDNENYIVDLATMPHLLMAGATGQGKSVGINAILVSLLYKKHPSQVKFVMVDPKKVELSIYRVIEKHFLAKLPNEEEAIITDTKKVINTLNALCIEMDNRYELLKEAGVRNIKEYNDKFIARRLNPEKGHKYLPFIVLVVDEFADLIMTAGKEVEMPIARLAQLARAVGIHLIIATQRPSVNVITGTIKANFPGRIAFKVSAKVDSRTILDTGGADQLIGRGDMLISHGSELLRVQCAFVDTPEVDKIVKFIGDQRGYATAFELPEYDGDEEAGSSKNVDLTNRDKLFEDCARTVVSSQSGSTSNLQRKFNLGYNRAGRIMDQLESAGIVGPAVGPKPREVYFSTEYELDQFLGSLL